MSSTTLLSLKYVARFETRRRCADLFGSRGFPRMDGQTSRTVHMLWLNTRDFFNIEYAFSLPGPIKPLSTKTVTGHTGFTALWAFIVALLLRGKI